MSKESKPREFNDYAADRAADGMGYFNGGFHQDKPKSAFITGATWQFKRDTEAFEALQTENDKLLSALKEAVGALEYYMKRCRPCNSHYGSDEEGFKNDNLHGCDCLIARTTLANLKAQVPGVGE